MCGVSTALGRKARVGGFSYAEKKAENLNDFES